MNSEFKLPDDVLKAVHANRKIDAIKLLREHRNLGLKEAKHVIDAYMAKYPHLVSAGRLREESGPGRIVVTGVLVLIIYLAYRFLS